MTPRTATAATTIAANKSFLMAEAPDAGRQPPLLLLFRQLEIHPALVVQTLRQIAIDQIEARLV